MISESESGLRSVVYVHLHTYLVTQLKLSPIFDYEVAATSS